MKSSVATKDEEIANAAAATEEAKAAVESAQQELAAANDKITALEAQLEEAKNVCLFFYYIIYIRADATNSVGEVCSFFDQACRMPLYCGFSFNFDGTDKKIKTEAPEPEIDNSALEAAQAELVSVKEDLAAAKDAAEANTAKVSDLEKQLEEKNAELEKSNQEVETINAQISGNYFWNI